jgi:hypothetical protein
MSAEPPDSPPIWWTCENECWKCRIECPRRYRPEPDLPDTIAERDDYEPNQRERDV